MPNNAVIKEQNTSELELLPVKKLPTIEELEEWAKCEPTNPKMFDGVREYHRNDVAKIESFFYDLEISGIAKGLKKKNEYDKLYNRCIRVAQKKAAAAEKEKWIAEEMERREARQKNSPNWLTYDKHDHPHYIEDIYIEEFLDKKPMFICDNIFYSADGAIESDGIISEIYKDLLPHFSENVSKKAKELFSGLQNMVHQETFSPNPKYIHVGNGVLTADNSGTYTQFEPLKEPCFNRIAAEWNGSLSEVGEPQAFLAYLSQLLQPDDIKTVQQFLGACLVPTTKMQKALILNGYGGEGKTTLTTIFKGIIGEQNTVGTGIDTVNESFGLAPIVNKLVFIDDDLDSSGLQKTGTLKTLITNTSGIAVNRKFKDVKSVKLYAKILLLGNNVLESLFDNSEGFYRRLHVIKVKEVTQNRKNDTEISSRILNSEAAQILAWCIDGLNELVRSGWNLYISAQSKAISDELMRDSDSVNAFIKGDSNLKFGANERISSVALNLEYQAWCSDNGLTSKKTATALTRALKSSKAWNDLGVKYANTHIGNKRVRGFVGVSVSGENQAIHVSGR